MMDFIAQSKIAKLNKRVVALEDAIQLLTSAVAKATGDLQLYDLIIKKIFEAQVEPAKKPKKKAIKNPPPDDQSGEGKK